MAHAVRVDSQDNIWAVDEGTDMVIKFNPEGRVVMLLGRRPEFGEGLLPTLPTMRRLLLLSLSARTSTDIAWDAAEIFFISDGYTNSRVVKYDKWGKFIKSVGHAWDGTQPIQHAALDSDRCQRQRICRGSGQPANPILSNDLTLRAIYDHVALLGRSASRPARINICTAPIQIR